MGRPVANLRLFAAVYPPEECARELLRRATESGAGGRAVDVECVHLTVQFIGDTAAARMEEVRESVRRSCAGIGAFRLLPVELITLPERGAPRLVAARTDEPAALLELHRRLAHRLARHPRARDEERFVPHLTLVRYAGGGARVAAALDGPTFEVRSVKLMRSTLQPGGARHHLVEQVGLEG
ncbi:MAG: RNA 2',3'-cyclic phosphodiesterase [Planctomycetota bacterium]|nr:RNA 2',3'-cyclic phosphodiesterase [Planctomycetota bacterium]